MSDDGGMGLFLIGLGCLLVGLILGYVVGWSERTQAREPERDPADWWKDPENDGGTWYGKAP